MCTAYCEDRRAAIGQKQSLEVVLQDTASGCMSGLSPDSRLDEATHKPGVPISGPSSRSAIDGGFNQSMQRLLLFMAAAVIYRTQLHSGQS